jgi:hypothetical protein
VTVSNYLKTAVGAQIVLFEAQAIFLNEICVPLHLGPNRVSRVLRIFRDNNTLPLISLRGRPKRVPPEILDFIDARTLSLPSTVRPSGPSELILDFTISQANTYKTWDSIPQAAINRVDRSFEARLQICLD